MKKLWNIFLHVFAWGCVLGPLIWCIIDNQKHPAEYNPCQVENK